MLMITTFDRDPFIKVKQFAFIIKLFHSTSITFIWFFFRSLTFVLFLQKWRPMTKGIRMATHCTGIYVVFIFFFFIILLCWILKSDCFFRPKELQNKRITEQPKTNQVCAVNCKFFIMLEANVHCKGHFSSRTVC